MRYIIFVRILGRKEPVLEAYTGVIHDNKQTALVEYQEAWNDPKISQVYLAII